MSSADDIVGTRNVVFDGEDGVAGRRAVDAGYKNNRASGTPEPIKALAEIKRGLDIRASPGSNSTARRPTT